MLVWGEVSQVVPACWVRVPDQSDHTVSSALHIGNVKSWPPTIMFACPFPVRSLIATVVATVPTPVVSQSRVPLGARIPLPVHPQTRSSLCVTVELFV